MNEAWRIDGFDARAGLAFASWREADLVSDNLQLERPAVFLSPPTFRPEVLASRAVGFGFGTRGQAQLGVFIDEAELGFDSLDELTEFVRRAYISSGGGDAGGGGGGGGRPRPPPIPEGGPDISFGERPEGETPFSARLIIETAKRAHEAAVMLSFQAGQPTPASVLPSHSVEVQPASSTSVDALGDGAGELVLEFLRRYPLRSRPDQMLEWYEGAHRLGAAIADLGLWSPLLGGRFGPVFDSAAKQIVGSLSSPLPLPSDRNLLPMLFEQSSSFWSRLPPWNIEEIFFFTRRHGLPLTWSGEARREGDPIDDLNAWPVSREVAVLTGSGQKNVSVLNLLSAVSGAPGKLGAEATSPAGLQASLILIFSVAHILGKADPRSGLLWFLPDVCNAGSAQMTERSVDWILRQWPLLIFPRVVEDLIGSAAALPVP